MTALFWLSVGAGVLIMWGVVEVIGWAIDRVTALISNGGPIGYSDPALRHRPAAPRGRSAGGLDVSESLSRHTARRSSPRESLVGAVPSHLPQDHAGARARYNDLRGDAYLGTTLTFPCRAAKGVNQSEELP